MLVPLVPNDSSVTGPLTALNLVTLDPDLVDLEAKRIVVEAIAGSDVVPLFVERRGDGGNHDQSGPYRTNESASDDGRTGCRIDVAHCSPLLRFAELRWRKTEDGDGVPVNQSCNSSIGLNLIGVAHVGPANVVSELKARRAAQCFDEPMADVSVADDELLA